MAAADVDAVVVGSGPNGLAAAITLARAGRSVRVLEAAEQIGGGTRTGQLTLPGFRHDVCSAVHPLAIASPVLQALMLAEHGCEFVQPEIPLAHPLDGGYAGVLHRSITETAEGLGADAAAYRALMEPTVPRRTVCPTSPAAGSAWPPPRTPWRSLCWRPPSRSAAAPAPGS